MGLCLGGLCWQLRQSALVGSLDTMINKTKYNVHGIRNAIFCAIELGNE